MTSELEFSPTLSRITLRSQDLGREKEADVDAFDDIVTDLKAKYDTPIKTENTCLDPGDPGLGTCERVWSHNGQTIRIGMLIDHFDKQRMTLLLIQYLPNSKNLQRTSRSLTSLK